MWCFSKGFSIGKVISLFFKVVLFSRVCLGWGGARSEGKEAAKEEIDREVAKLLTLKNRLKISGAGDAAAASQAAPKKGGGGGKKGDAAAAKKPVTDHPKNENGTPVEKVQEKSNTE